MKINILRYCFFSILLLTFLSLSAQAEINKSETFDIEDNQDSVKFNKYFSIGIDTYVGIGKSLNYEELGIATKENIKNSVRLGFNYSYKLSISYQIWKKTSFSIGIGSHRTKLESEMLKNDIDSSKYNNNDYSYFNEEFNINLFYIPLHVRHLLVNNKFGLSLEYGVSIIYPLSVIYKIDYFDITNHKHFFTNQIVEDKYKNIASNFDLEIELFYQLFSNLYLSVSPSLSVSFANELITNEENIGSLDLEYISLRIGINYSFR